MKKKCTRTLFFLTFVLSWPIAIGCASQTSREKIDAIRASAKHKPAADYMDGFWLDYRSPPDREVEHWEFYYKTCTLISRKPWPDRAEYDCLGPH